MLDQVHRFHGLNSLAYVHRHGQSVRSAQLALKYSLNRRRKTYRVAVVVSRKVDKSAVVRNRIRRRIYEAVRVQAQAIDQPYDLVFMVFNAQLVDISAVQLHQQIGTLLERAGVIKTAKPAAHAIVKTEE